MMGNPVLQILAMLFWVASTHPSIQLVSTPFPVQWILVMRLWAASTLWIQRFAMMEKVARQTLVTL